MGRPHTPNQAKIAHVAASAKKKMSATRKPAKSVQRCPHAVKDPPAQYEYCELKSLQVALRFDQKTRLDRTLTAQLRQQPVAPSVYSKYWAALATHELVIETLAEIENTTDTVADGKVTTAPTADSKTLTARLLATNTSRHFSFAPPHPHTCADGPESHGGAEVRRNFFAASRASAGAGWLRVWPFTAERTRRHSLGATACGVAARPGALKELGVQLVVIPSEEWEISLGLNKGGGSSVEYQQIGEVENITRIRDWKARFGDRTTTTKDFDGNFQEGSKTTFLGGNDFEEKKSLVERDRNYIIGSKTYVLEHDDTTKEAKPAGRMPTARDSLELNKISVKLTSAGEKQEWPVSDVLNPILALADVSKKLQKLIPKVGWSVTFGHSWLQGALVLKWGNRYPDAYAEEARVYYVERYISVGGTCTLYKGSIEGMFGLEFDPWWYPASICAKIALKAEATLKAGGKVELAHTNPEGKGKGEAVVEASFDVALTLEAKAGGRIHGSSVTARLALEGKIESSAKWTLGFTHEPSLVVNAKAKPLQIVGQIVQTGASAKTRQFEPYVFWEGGTLCKDHYIWGKKPAATQDAIGAFKDDTW